MARESVKSEARNDVALQSAQVRFSRFIHCYNRLLAEPTIYHYELVRKEGLDVVDAHDCSPEMQETVEAMIEQLNWYAELCGDWETGEPAQADGYPANYVYVGDAQELMRYVPDQSIHLIFTDPPYIQSQIHLYGWLAQEAERVLTPDGFLMAYVGTYWKDSAMALMRPYMEYFWDYAIVHGGDLPLQRNRRTRAGAKSILCYRKQGSMAVPQTEVQGVYQGTGASKEYHHWGQPVDEAEYYISRFSKAGDVVLDPFIGGGTTAVACVDSNRNWIGFEIDNGHAQTAQQRLDSLSCKVSGKRY